MDPKEKVIFKNIDDYIAFQPEKVRPFLDRLRETIRKAAPKAEETISYGMPAYKLHGILVYFAAFKNHYSLFALPKSNEDFKDRLKEYKTSKGTIQFTFDKPVPVKLVTDIVKQRVAENMEKKMMQDLKKKKK